MQRRFPALAVLFVFALLVAGCAPQVAPVVATAVSAATSIPVTGPTVSSAATKVSSVIATQAATMMPPSTMPPSTSVPSTMMPSTGAAAHIGVANSQFGSILVNGNGMTLYLFTNDSPNTPTCYATCATIWPPLLTTGAPAGGMGLDASKLGTAMRTDGTTQVTYNGWPLYTYSKDNQPGDVNGERVAGSWFVVSPSGNPIK